MYIVGIGWLFLLPTDDINGGVYIDENALMPGYASVGYDGDWKVMQLAEELKQVTWSVSASRNCSYSILGDINSVMLLVGQYHVIGWTISCCYHKTVILNLVIILLWHCNIRKIIFLMP